MRGLRHRLIHLAWRLAWGAYEMRRNRFTAALFDRLDAMHEPFCFRRRVADTVIGHSCSNWYCGICNPGLN